MSDLKLGNISTNALFYELHFIFGMFYRTLDELIYIYGPIHIVFSCLSCCRWIVCILEIIAFLMFLLLVALLLFFCLSSDILRVMFADLLRIVLYGLCCSRKKFRFFILLRFAGFGINCYNSVWRTDYQDQVKIFPKMIQHLQ